VNNQLDGAGGLIENFSRTFPCCKIDGEVNLVFSFSPPVFEPYLADVPTRLAFSAP